MSRVVKYCGHAGCRQLVTAGLCAEHRRQKNQTYGRAHRNTRPQIMAAHGWRCHYCGDPVTLSDDIAHLEKTQGLKPRAAHQSPRVPAHRGCHNKHAPHLNPAQSFA